VFHLVLLVLLRNGCFQLCPVVSTPWLSPVFWLLPFVPFVAPWFVLQFPFVASFCIIWWVSCDLIFFWRLFWWMVSSRVCFFLVQVDGLLQGLLLHGWTWWAGWWGCTPPKGLLASKWTHCQTLYHLHVSITNSCHEQGPLCRTFFGGLGHTLTRMINQACMFFSFDHMQAWCTISLPHPWQSSCRQAHHCLMMRFASWKHPFLTASNCDSK